MRTRRFVLAASLCLGTAVFEQTVSPAPVAATMTSDVAGMTITPVLSGLPDTPVGVRFAPDGRIYVAIKDGRVLMYDAPGDTTPQTTLDIRTSVNSNGDRGLLGIALDPAFATGRPYLYALYVYDRDPFGTNTTVPRWNDACPTPPGPNTDGCSVTGRLDRYTINASGIATGSPLRLLDGVGGATGGWCNQFPSHAIGTLDFAADGSLYVGSGDGASYNFADYGQAGGSTNSPTPPNPCNDKQGTNPRTGGRGTAMTARTSRGGALRTQAVRGALANDYISWDGAILRIDPNTGNAASGNPLVNNGITGDDRIVAYGLRNPYRFSIRPGTNELWLADVGWNTYEEVNTFVTGATQSTVPNFGWPCYEGPGRMGSYDSLDIDLCESLYTNNTSSLGGVSSPLVAPKYSWRRYGNSGALPCSTTQGGGSATGGSFVANDQWPTALRGAYVFGDYARGCLMAMPLGSNGVPDASRVTSLVSDTAPVDIKPGPGGDIYWLDVATNQLNRLRPVAGNLAPVASFTATPSSGNLPLTVQFDASATTDPNPGEVLTFNWDLDGDGACDDGSGRTISRNYSVAATVIVKLCVVDQLGAANTTTRTIQPGNSPPSIQSLTTSADTIGWKVGDVVTFSANATDPNGTLAANAYTWSQTIRHCDSDTSSNCHSHSLSPIPSGKTGSITMPDHEYYASIRLTLTVTDPGGLTATRSVDLLPRISNVSVQTSPPAIAVSVGGRSGASPVTASFLEAGSTQLTVPNTAVLGGTERRFVRWSDSSTMSLTRTVAAPAGNTTYTAVYDSSAPTVANASAAPNPADLRTVSSVTITADVSDDIGVGSVTGRLIRDGTTLQVTMTRTSGTNLSGRWSGTVAVPAGTALGSYAVSVVATDTVARTTTGTGPALTVTRTAAPVIQSLTTSADASKWKVGDTVTFTAVVTDDQGSLPSSGYTWSLQHRQCTSSGAPPCVTNALSTPTSSGRTGSFVVGDLPYRSTILLTLVVRDAQGLSATRTVELQPRTSRVVVDSSPSGVPVAIDDTPGAAPLTADVHEGAAVEVFAPARAVVGRVDLILVGWADIDASGWSNNVEGTRRVTAPAGGVTLTAIYDAAPPVVTAVAGDQTKIDPRSTSDLVVTADITDDRGVSSAAAVLSGPSGASFTAPMAPPSAASPNGRWTATITLPADAPLGDYTLTVVATDIAGRIADGAGAPVTVRWVESEPPPVLAGGTMRSVTPLRLLDTREGTGAPIGQLTPAGTLRLQVAGVTGVPSGITAVVVNITAVDSRGPGYVTAFPCGPVPTVSNVNVSTARPVANLATVVLDADGGFCLTSMQPVDVVIDLAAVVLDRSGTGDRYTGITPRRVVDTREGFGLPLRRIAAGEIVSVPLAPADLPQDATAVVANITVADPTKAGFITAFPCGGVAPLASNVNFVAGQSVSNLAVTALGATGELCVRASVDTHLVVDVSGWLSPTGSTASFVAPTRALDTRDAHGRMASGEVIVLDAAALGAPEGATAMVANVTVVDPVAAGFLTVYPCDGGKPFASGVNHGVQETRPGLSIVSLGADRTVCVFTYVEADLVVDIQGWTVAR